MITKFDLSIQTVEAEADRRFRELAEFLSKLEEIASSQRRQTLIGVFKTKVVGPYFDKAKLLIGGATQPHQRSQDYDELLSRLQDHILLLADFTRAQSETIFKQQTALNKMLKIVSKRIPSAERLPVLLVTLSSDFEYVHFNYLSQPMGMIGVPPQIVSSPFGNGNLAVLWHEVAGHAIAVARRSPHDLLKKWAAEFKAELEQRNLWPIYRDLYITSILENLPVKEQLEKVGAWAEFRDSYRLKVLADAPIDANQEWQATWLAEFFEDLYWLTVFTGETDVDDLPIRIMSRALTPRYADLAVGDPEHPPVNLRLLVGLASLDLGSFDTRRKGDKFYSDQANLLSLVEPITTFCRRKIETAELYRPAASSEEKTLAKIILDSNPQTAQANLEKLLETANLGAASLNQLDVAADFLAKIEQAANLTALLDLEFTDNDWWGWPGQGVTSWRRPRFRRFRFGPH
jgi:hypothetical protein